MHWWMVISCGQKIPVTPKLTFQHDIKKVGIFLIWSCEQLQRKNFKYLEGGRLRAHEYVQQP